MLKRVQTRQDYKFDAAKEGQITRTKHLTITSKSYHLEVSPGIAAVVHSEAHWMSRHPRDCTGCEEANIWACSAMTDAREAGSQICSREDLSILSSRSCSGHWTAAASTSVSAGSSSRLLTSRCRRAPGKCVFSTDAQRSSLSTCIITS